MPASGKAARERWPPAAPPRDEIEALIDREGLPRVAEIKHDPDGSTSQAACRLLVRDEEHVALFHPLSDRWEVARLVIAPPSFTLAFYWADVPYNPYVWFEESGSFEGAYFNIVRPEGYRLAPGRLLPISSRICLIRPLGLLFHDAPEPRQTPLAWPMGGARRCAFGRGR
jgi:hypothetical protein